MIKNENKKAPKTLDNMLVNIHLDVCVCVHGCIFCNSICQLFEANILPSLRATSCPSTFPTAFLTPLFSCFLRNPSSSFLNRQRSHRSSPQHSQVPFAFFSFHGNYLAKAQNSISPIIHFLGWIFLLMYLLLHMKNKNKPFLNSSLPSAYCQELGLEPFSLGSNPSSAFR